MVRLSSMLQWVMMVHALWVDEPACQTYKQPILKYKLFWLSRWCTSMEGLQRIHILTRLWSEDRTKMGLFSHNENLIWWSEHQTDQNTKLKRSVACKKCLGLSSKLCMDFIVEFVDENFICGYLQVCSRLECAMMIESQTLQVYYFCFIYLYCHWIHDISPQRNFINLQSSQEVSICFLHMCAINHMMMGFKFVERKIWDYFFWWQMVGCEKSPKLDSSFLPTLDWADG